MSAVRGGLSRLAREVERLAVEDYGGLGRVGGARLPARASVPHGRARWLARPLEVLGDDGGVLLNARPALLDKPLGRLAVEPSAFALQDVLVGDASQQRVLEGVLGRPGEGGRLASEDELLAP